MAKKLVAIVIDGLTPDVFEDAIERRATPVLAELAAHGEYRRATTVFPSLTPVCVSSLATGAYPDVHRIPHLVWYDRTKRRVVEYGSSFPAIVAAGTRRSIVDTIFNMNARHLGPVHTVFEALCDAGYVTAAVNFTCYRGRTEHRTTLPGVTRIAHGPERFFYYNLFESDETGAPLSVRRRSSGTVDDYAVYVGRWLVTRDGFDFFVYYLSDLDYASHAVGPARTAQALVRVDTAIGAIVGAAGGIGRFLERYAVIVCSDHGQTPVHTPVALRRRFRRLPVVVTPSNRAAMVYRLDPRHELRSLAARLDAEPSVEVTLFLDQGAAVARREGEEVRFVPHGQGWQTSGDASILDHPDAFTRAWAALHNPVAGDILVSAAEGYEFVDLGGRHHAGGGSHGSLVAGDSEVPMLSIGAGPAPAAITDVKASVLRHFGVTAARAAA